MRQKFVKDDLGLYDVNVKLITMQFPWEKGRLIVEKIINWSFNENIFDITEWAGSEVYFDLSMEEHYRVITSSEQSKLEEAQRGFFALSK